MVASATPDQTTLDSIFWPEARVIDRARPEVWTYRDFYPTQRFTDAFRFSETRHENLISLDSLPSQLTIGSDSCGKFQAAGGPVEMWGNIRGDRWRFESRSGIWKVIELAINNPPPTIALYTFEDGTLGCWNRSWEGGQFLGVSLDSSSSEAHDGTHSLALGIDLSQPGEHRARIEHRTSQALTGITEMSAWVLYVPEGETVPLEAEFFVRDTRDTSDNWHTGPTVESLLPDQWVRVKASEFDEPLNDTPSQMLGLEIKLPLDQEAEHIRGVIFVDDLTIQTDHGR